jgi:hypothetical protein
MKGRINETRRTKHEELRRHIDWGTKWHAEKWRKRTKKEK